jgi:hypothetical protein
MGSRKSCDQGRFPREWPGVGNFVSIFVVKSSPGRALAPRVTRHRPEKPDAVAAASERALAIK